MAEVDFGDNELFEQLDEFVPQVSTHIRFKDVEEEEEEDREEAKHFRGRMEECEDHIQRLTEENILLSQCMLALALASVSLTRESHQVLRRKLNILTRPSGITIGDVNMDGPLLQILYANNSISKQCRQEIEDCICSVIMKHQKPSHEKKSSFHVKPQNSAFALDEDPLKSSSSSVETTSEAFKVVGSVLYFTTFSVDKLGQPLVNENPQLTEGWDLPTYHQVFNQIVGTDGQDIEMKDKRPKSMCFNCGSGSHQIRDCPKPKDMAAISERRKEFNQNNSQSALSNQRYHADEVEERFAKYKPGVISEELLTALGIDANTLPPLIYRMRQLGYPPGWLKEAEMEDSGLLLYDGNAPNNGSGTENSNSQNTSYDVSKLVDFPGFNVPASDTTKDDFMLYGSLPMQSNHMKHNYAAYLSNNFPMPGANCNKRRHDSDESSPQQKKKNRHSPDRYSCRSSDMDIESDPGTLYNNGPGDFHFQPPLPPGSPCFSSPPPLPQGTPPATPTPPPLPKGTPPLTPNNGSPALRGQNWVVVNETVEGTDDELTLEELEEQQRLIWAALENADTATSSDCETPAMGTPLPSSPSVSTPAQVDTETEEDAMDTMTPAESCHSGESQREKEVQEICPQSPGPIKVQDDSPESPKPPRDGSPESPEPPKVQDDSPQSPEPPNVQNDSPQSPEPPKVQNDSPQSPEPLKVRYDSPEGPELLKVQENSTESLEPLKAQDNSLQNPDAGAENCASLKHDDKVTAVPHRSKFAAGIVPFEETPEFTEVAEATGTYLRIRDLLKCSPRSLAKKK
ncbi:zinc finger CCHC domain-containing protein 8 isoform X1 [Solea senegalensis]|uniref:Zinc finger CCHC domain-containing protein 8 n=3 Tax=Solea senegalensis TaxID=28829 RepID=A0AAV6QHL1_SOLSE|nr:zinc finger CCHC domain-containing protein 8 isoform X1 [Solea senegalensis]